MKVRRRTCSLVVLLFVGIALSLSVFLSQQHQEYRQQAATDSPYYPTLPPGSALPDDATCAARVIRNPWEPRPDNYTANHTTFPNYQLPGNSDPSYYYHSRVTGNFTGTTDEIFQWAACKWGFDIDTIRAQAVEESNWHQSTLGDCRGGTVPETHGCQSVGILQVKGADIPPNWPGTWPYAYQSTAWNVDFAMEVRRACYDGKITWLGNGYQAGDLWGCIGHWLSGGWHDSEAQNYISHVQHNLANRVWDTYGAGSAPTFPAVSSSITDNPTHNLSVTPTSPYSAVCHETFLTIADSRRTDGK